MRMVMSSGSPYDDQRPRDGVDMAGPLRPPGGAWSMIFQPRACTAFEDELVGPRRPRVRAGSPARRDRRRAAVAAPAARDWSACVRRAPRWRRDSENYGVDDVGRHIVEHGKAHGLRGEPARPAEQRQREKRAAERRGNAPTPRAPDDDGGGTGQQQRNAGKKNADPNTARPAGTSTTWKRVIATPTAATASAKIASLRLQTADFATGSSTI